MITLLAFIVGTIIIGKFFKDCIAEEFYSWKHCFTWFFLMLFMTCTIYLIAAGCGIVLFALCHISGLINAYEVKRINCETPIYSLKTDKSFSGSFFLGSGSIGSSESYYMYSRNNNGGFERFILSIDSSTIFQDENKSPKVSWQRITYQYPRFWTWFTISWDRDTRYDIHVPENTIIQQFKVE